MNIIEPTRPQVGGKGRKRRKRAEFWPSPLREGWAIHRTRNGAGETERALRRGARRRGK